jgi:hypothetical protein
MRRPSIVALALGLGGVALATVVALGHAASAAQAAPVTFSKDVLPILQKNCQSCHRPGEIAPMSFLTYESTRPWAKAIKSAVLTKKMPPWFADPQDGRFSNDRSLKPEEIDTLSRWVDESAPMGNPADAPPPAQWAEGWQIAPDHVVTAPPYTVPAQGAIEWGYIVVPIGFTTDTWVTSIEIRPGHRESVHHVVAYVQPSSPNVPHNVLIWDQKQRDANGVATPGQAFLNPSMVTDTGQLVNKSAILDGELGAVYVPGGQPQDFRARGAAKLIPAGSDLVINVHYQAVGKPVTEITRIGFTLAREEPALRFMTLARQPRGITDPKAFRIPAGDANWASPPVEITFNVDAELVWMMPHMHARGKDMTYRVTYPDGRSEIALRVPRYDFNWQLGYTALIPLKLAKGTTLRVDAHFDNSAANRGNPDPTVDVYGGTQTWEEMMNPWLGIVFDRRLDPSTVVTTTAARGGA